jgi:hypothetical protein
MASKAPFFPDFKIQLTNQDMSCPRKMAVSEVWLGPQIELTKLITLSNPTNLTSGRLV